MKSQEGHEDMAEDDLMLNTSQNARRKWETRYRGRIRKKAANIVIQNPASDKPILKVMPLYFSNDPQLL